jgi:hypothetical protein
MANAWFRLYSEFAHDPKVQTMPVAMQRHLIMLFCLRCEGKPLRKYSDEEIAYFLQITPLELPPVKSILEKKGFIDNTWEILNWDKRQYVSDSSTDRVRQYRERMKQDETLLKRGETENVTVPEQIQNRTDTEQKQKKPAAKAKPLQFILPDWIDKNAWAGFEEMRKKKRAPMTDRARAGIVQDLEKLCPVGDNGAAILDQSTKKCWSGVFPLSRVNGGFNANLPTGKTDSNMAILEELIAEDQHRSRAAENGFMQAGEDEQDGPPTLLVDSGAARHESFSGGDGYDF